MKVQLNDIFEINGHIIACGDSLDPLFVAKAINGRKMRAVITDPPYGVDYVKNKFDMGIHIAAKAKEIIGDEIQTDVQYADFTKKWCSAVIPHLDNYNTFHVFNSDLMFFALKQGMMSAGITFSQMLIWLKNQPVMSMKDYISQFEVIAYGWHGKHKFERSKTKNVIFHPKPSRSKLHPTQKPLGLIRKIIPNVTKYGDYVYDPFLGSGTTLLSAEQLGRKCVGIEMDPEYVEIIIKRVEKLTKKKAVRIN